MKSFIDIYLLMVLLVIDYPSLSKPLKSFEAESCLYENYSRWAPEFSLACSRNGFQSWWIKNKARLNGESPTCRGQKFTIDLENFEPKPCIYNFSSGDKIIFSPQSGKVFMPPISAGSSYVREQLNEALCKHDCFGENKFLGWAFNPYLTNIKPIIGNVRNFTTAKSFQTQYEPSLLANFTHFSPVSKKKSTQKKTIIYLEGHGGKGVKIGAEIIQQFLIEGYHVVALDMPLAGMNEQPNHEFLRGHNDFLQLDDGNRHPVGLFLVSVRIVMDFIKKNPVIPSEKIVLVGRSGGGWLAYTYGALDGSVYAVVSIAGGTPLGIRLNSPAGPYELGDYEQYAPSFYSKVSHEQMMAIAGEKGSFHIYNTFDTCCFGIRDNIPFINWLRGQATNTNRIIKVHVDPSYIGHGASANSLKMIINFVSNI